MTTPAPVPAQRGPYIEEITDLPWPKAVQFLSADGSRLLFSMACLLVGWAFAETSGTAAFSLDLFNGADTTGHRVASVAAPANGAGQAGPGWPGIAVPDGLYGSVASGTFDGAVWVVPMVGGIR